MVQGLSTHEETEASEKSSQVYSRLGAMGGERAMTGETYRTDASYQDLGYRMRNGERPAGDYYPEKSHSAQNTARKG